MVGNTIGRVSNATGSNQMALLASRECCLLGSRLGNKAETLLAMYLGSADQSGVWALGGKDMKDPELHVCSTC